MASHSKNISGIAALALAASVVGVGALWAGTSALRDSGTTETRSESTDTAESSTTMLPTTTTDGTAPGDNDGDLPLVPPQDPDQPDDSTELDELKKLVRDLGEQVETLAATVATSTDAVAALEKKVGAVVDDVDGIDSRLNKTLSEVKALSGDVASAKLNAAEAKADAADALEKLAGISSTVSTLEKRTSKLNDEGAYSGPVNPSQFTRKLTTADITGNWPLNRVSEKLRTENLEVVGFGCTNDFRYNTVLVVNSFRGVECVRLAK